MGQEGSTLNDPTSSSPTITDPDGHDESRTGQKERISGSPFTNKQQTTDNDDDECKRNFHSNRNNYQKTRTNQVYVI